jgi:hypothetical protein
MSMSEKTQIRLKRETSLSLVSPPNTATAFEGFLLKIEVEKAYKISPKIFVMQRDVNSGYIADGVLDSFFSVASVGELEWIPEDAPVKNGTNFYRTNSIELVFESREDLESGWKKIKADVYALAKANDVTFEVAEELLFPFPEDSLPMYYGTSHLSLSGLSAIQSLSKNPVYTSEYQFSFVAEVATYVYFAVHRSLGQELNVRVNGSITSMTKTLVEVPAIYGGGNDEYYLYKSSPLTAPISGTISISKI